MQKVLQQIYDAGDIYFGEYGGFYCYGCERFYTEKELVDGKCPDHQRAPEYISEKNYFFRMSKYQERLIETIQSQTRFDSPGALPHRGLGLSARAARGSLHLAADEPLAMGHPAALRRELRHLRLVRRVAQLRERLGASRRRSLATFWPTAQHLIAKDILKPHAIFWPTMLMAAGLPLYDHLNVHGYWVMDSGKMSKSLGNVIRPLEMKARFGMDAFPLFLAARDGVRPGRQVLRGGAGDADQRRSGQQSRQSREPRAGDAAEIFCRCGAAFERELGGRGCGFARQVYPG